MLIGTAFPQRNEVRAYLCLGSTQIAQWIVRAAAALALRCTRVLLRQYLYLGHQYSCLCLSCDLQDESGVIVRFRPLAWSTDLHGKVNLLASLETTVLETGFGPGGAGDPFEPFYCV
jgi:hypothetical protein